LKVLDNDRVELASVTGCKGSDWYGTEADFAMKRFLEYTESLCDSPPASFPGSPTQPPSEEYDGLDTQEGTQDTTSSCQPNDINSTMTFTGKQSPGLHFSTAHPQIHLVYPSARDLKAFSARVVELPNLVSKPAASSALNSQSLSGTQHPPGSSQGIKMSYPAIPLRSSQGIKMSYSAIPPGSSQGFKMSYPAIDRGTEVDQPPMDDAPIPKASPESINYKAKPQISTTSADLGRLGLKSIYSKSGFDAAKALWLIQTRKTPQINIGAVDMSCSFVVCDITLEDCPIVYVSDNFQKLTGYGRNEAIGRNCRFLQAPDGKVERGSQRVFVDDRTIHGLKNNIRERRESQMSLINYRKGGKPFLNLLSIIPIPWDTEEIRYYVGFQIDLIESPNAI
jgi:PAS domain S-box-containing protein